MLNLSSKYASDNKFINNCIVESFGIHARCLRDFFFKSDGKEGDMFAVDFIDNRSDWFKYIGGKQNVLNGVNSRVGKELAHLTYDRVGKTDEEKQWPKSDMAAEINKLAQDFFNMVPDNRLCDDAKVLKKTGDIF